MNAKTATTLDQLRPGDRFYYASDKKRTVWEVITNGITVSTVNEVTSIPGIYVWMLPKVKQADTKVIFLRHTQESINQKDALTGIV